MEVWIMVIGMVAAIVISLVVSWFCKASNNHSSVAPVIAGSLACGLVFIGAMVFASLVANTETSVEHTKIECVECGEEVAADDKFCAGCGQSLK